MISSIKKILYIISPHSQLLVKFVAPCAPSPRFVLPPAELDDVNKKEVFACFHDSTFPLLPNTKNRSDYWKTEYRTRGIARSSACEAAETWAAETKWTSQSAARIEWNVRGDGGHVIEAPLHHGGTQRREALLNHGVVHAEFERRKLIGWQKERGKQWK